MTRWLTIVLGAIAVVVAVALAWQGMSRWQPPKAEAHGVDGSTAVLAGDRDRDFDGGAEPVSLREGRPVRERDGGVGFTMLDGTPAPALPAGSPRAVRFGVVLVAYAGAEDAPPQARARGKHDALELAEKLAAQAKTDFHAAVRRGDDGSSDDVGGMQRGIIEPAPEFVLFSLPVGGTSDPIDTPRGYWIVKRIE